MRGHFAAFHTYYERNRQAGVRSFKCVWPQLRMESMPLGEMSTSVVTMSRNGLRGIWTLLCKCVTAVVVVDVVVAII